MTGRLLGAKIHTATYLFVGKSVFRLQIVRFISLVLIVGAAVALFIFLLRQNVHGFWAILLLIFFFSQRGFQAYSAYSLETFHQIICFPIGMAAFYLAFYYDPQTRVGEIVKYSFVFLLLMSTALIMQSLLFFSLIPVAFLILRDDWKNNQKKIIVFITLTVFVAILSLIVVKAGISYLNEKGQTSYSEKFTNSLQEEPLETLKNGINPFFYWRAFEIWTYPVPFMELGSMKKRLAIVVMFLWLSIVLWAFYLNWCSAESSKDIVFKKWIFAFVTLVLCALPVLADRGSLRGHTSLPLTGGVIFTGAYAFSVILKSLRVSFPTIQAKASVIVALLVALSAFGAQANLTRGYILPKSEALWFLRSELMKKPMNSFSEIFVLVPGKEEYRNARCFYEPCNIWAGNYVHYRFHMMRPRYYKYALLTLGVDPSSKKISFGENIKEKPDNALVVDWQRYAKMRFRYKRYLRSL